MKLRKLGDQILELEVAKADPHLEGVRYFDTARGVNSIITLLPREVDDIRFDVQESNTAFPPFFSSHSS